MATPLYIFASANSANGSELWVADADFQSRRLLKDINPGLASSDVTDLTQLTPGKAIFVANDDVHGCELWITDGTNAGTRMLRDIGTGDGTYGPTNLVASGDGRAFFTANNDISGNELWVTDGTWDGTQRLMDGVAGAVSSAPDAVMAVGNGHWIFTAYGADGAKDLWTTDGTAAGTKIIRDVTAAEGLSFRDITVSAEGGTAIVHSNKGSFTTDGTPQGTGALVARPLDIDYHAVEGGRWVFADLDRTNTYAREYSLFSTDGTAAGTVKLLDPSELLIGGKGGGEAKLTDLGNGKVIMQAGFDLWITDGTKGGTHSVADGVLSYKLATDFVSLGDGRALFMNQTLVAPTPTNPSSRVTKADLWVTDGTKEGTFQIADSQTWNAGSLPDKVSVLADGSVIFSAASLDGNPNAVWHVNMWGGGLERLGDVSNWAGEWQPTQVVGLQAPTPPTTIELSDIAAGLGGFKIIGEAAGDFAGRSLSSVGDVNGDGFADLLIGADYNAAGGDSAGAAYVVYGKADGATVNLDDVASSVGGFKIIGEAARSYAGTSVSAAGDVNGDGLVDFLIGSPGNSARANTAGAAYVVFGQANSETVNLDAVAAGTGGFKIIGEVAGDAAGGSVATLGDVNGDGLADLLIGAQSNDAGGNLSGASYVVYGKASGEAVDLGAVAAGQGGFKIIGNAGENSGVSVSGAGDVNGDGFNDLIVGALLDSTGGTYSGAAYVVFGSARNGTVDLNDVGAGEGGFKIFGEALYNGVGRNVSDAGDVNGDGLADLIVGASSNGSAGAAYVVFGKAGTEAVNLDAVAAGQGGFKIIGEAGGDAAGTSVSSAGDVNGDGLTDLLVGARGNDAGGSFAGAAYLVFGKADGVAVNLSSVVEGQAGFKIIGEAVDDTAGNRVSAAGDVNGDGLADLLVGALQHDAGGADAGAAYVIYGSSDWHI